MVLIMMVLYIHSYYLEGYNYTYSYAIQRFLGTNGIMSVSVLLFFTISGYLFFNGITAAKDCFPKIRKRTFTLGIPYIIWNIVFVLWYVMLEMLPMVSSFVNSDILSNFNTFYDGFCYLFIEPASFPLWFLRDLIFFVACSPLIFFLIKYLRWWAVPVAIIATKMIPFVGFFYFVIGGCVAILSSLEAIEKIIDKRVVMCCILIYLLMCGYLAIQPIEKSFVYNYWLSSIQGIVGIIAVWRGYDYLAKGKSYTNNKWLSAMCGYSFFVYLFHEPVFNIVKKIPIRLLGDTEPVVIVLFLINPFIMYFVAVFFAKLLQKTLPKVYSILVGGR